MPLSPRETQELLARLAHRPRHALGQNFLVDGNIVRKSLALGAVGPGDRIVEVGPGLGTLTAALLEAGAEVWAVEKDPGLAAHLRAELAPRFPGLRLIEGDAVEHPRAGLEETPFKIVANLPYAIATPWLDAVLSGPLPQAMILMLQQEAAQRYTAEPGSKSFGAISIFLQAAYETAGGHRVAAACFHPRPEVESRLLSLRLRPDPARFPPRSRDAIRAIFQRRRKQIGALARAACPGVERAWMEQLEGAGYSPRSRPEEIPVSLWIGLSNLLESHTP